eukprot:3687961-Amphidinium_carterae.1
MLISVAARSCWRTPAVSEKHGMTHGLFSTPREKTVLWGQSCQFLLAPRALNCISLLGPCPPLHSFSESVASLCVT